MKISQYLTASVIFSFSLINLSYHPPGPAPVATYFRPTPPPSLPQPAAEGSDNAALTTPAAAAAAKTGFGGQKRLTNDDETQTSERVVEPCEAEGAKGARGAKGGDGGGMDEQKWELLDKDDGAELTARFRGRKFM